MLRLSVASEVKLLLKTISKSTANWLHAYSKCAGVRQEDNKMTGYF